MNPMNPISTKTAIFNFIQGNASIEELKHIQTKIMEKFPNTSTEKQQNPGVLSTFWSSPLQSVLLLNTISRHLNSAIERQIVKMPNQELKDLGVKIQQLNQTAGSYGFPSEDLKILEKGGVGVSLSQLEAIKTSAENFVLLRENFVLLRNDYNLITCDESIKQKFLQAPDSIKQLGPKWTSNILIFSASWVSQNIGLL